MNLQCLVYVVATLDFPAFVTSSTSNGSEGISQNSTEVYNHIFSLEAETLVGEIGSTFIFYISFIEDLFQSFDSIFLVTVTKDSALQNKCRCTDKNTLQDAHKRYRTAQTFMQQFDKEGKYVITVNPFSETMDKNDQKASLVLQVTVKSQVGTECQHVGEFLINDIEASSFITNNFTRSELTGWIAISSKGISCTNWRARKPKWSIEKIHMKIPEVIEIPQCVNGLKIRKMDIPAFMSHYLHVPLPGPESESGFIIQPSTLPPGLYRICNTVSGYNISLKHCGYLAMVPVSGDCTPFTNAVRIHMIPESEEFTWPIKDLILNVTSHYSVFALPEAGYFGDVLHGHTWECSGSSICKTFKSWGEFYKGDMADGLELNAQDTELLVPAYFQTAGVTVTFTFLAEFQDPLFDDFICRKAEERHVTFVPPLQGVLPISLSIICLVNCWNNVNPERPMLLALLCSGCKDIFFAGTTTMSWSVVDLEGAKFHGENTLYFTVTEYGQPTAETFTVRMKYRYRSESGQSDEIVIGRIFRIAELLTYEYVNTNDLITESKENSGNISDGISAIFARYSVSPVKLYSTIKMIPVIITVKIMVDDEEEEGEDSELESYIPNYVLLRTVWTPLDFCIETLGKIKSKQRKVAIELSTREGRQNFKLEDNVFTIPVPDTKQSITIEQLWKFTQEWSFIVNDQTYLATISRAIEEASSSRESMTDYEQPGLKNESEAKKSEIQRCTFPAAIESTDLPSNNSSSTLSGDFQYMLLNETSDITNTEPSNLTSDTSSNTTYNDFSNMSSSTSSNMTFDDSAITEPDTSSNMTYDDSSYLIANNSDLLFNISSNETFENSTNITSINFLDLISNLSSQNTSSNLTFNASIYKNTQTVLLNNISSADENTANVSKEIINSTSSKMTLDDSAITEPDTSENMTYDDSSYLISYKYDLLFNISSNEPFENSTNITSINFLDLISNLSSQNTSSNLTFNDSSLYKTTQTVLLNNTFSADENTANVSTEIINSPENKNTSEDVTNTPFVWQKTEDINECENTTEVLEVDYKKDAHDTFPTNQITGTVEKILNKMLSEDENGLSYSNMNLYLVSLVRILSIQSYSTKILMNSIKVLTNVHALHQSALEDPAIDRDLISLKFETLHALSVFMRRFLWHKQEIVPYSQEIKCTTDIVKIINSILNDIPRRLPMRYPTITIFASKRFTTQALWIDVFDLEEDLVFDLNTTTLIMNRYALQYTMFIMSMGTFLDVVVYMSRIASLPNWYWDIQLISPVLYISVQPKHDKKEEFELYSPGMYNIRYAFDMTSATFNSINLNIGVYRRTLPKRITVQESDCYFFRIEASTRFASIITLKPTSGSKLSVRIGLSDKLSVGLKTIYSNELFLPNYGGDDKKCHELASRAFSIFLPALYLWQQIDPRETLYYYVVLKVVGNQTSEHIKSKTASLVKIREENVNLKCYKVACVKWTESSYVTKNCRVNACGGFQKFISCTCDEGNIFTAGVAPCATHNTFLSRNQIQLKYYNEYDATYIIPTFIIFLWMFFLSALRIARRRDSLERHLGNTFALEGVFSPFKSEQYLMCLVTGFGVNCGTKSVPYMTIIGTERVSERYSLKAEHFIFTKGAETWLLVSAPIDLGKPRRVVISLEPEYSQVSTWFVKELYIKHLASEDEWTCTFNKWIPDKTNFSFPFLVADATKKRCSGKLIFGPILLRLLRNRHPVFSIFYSVPGTQYSKVQRVIFCFWCFLFVMAISFKIHTQPYPRLTGDEVDEVHTTKSKIYGAAILSAILSLLPTYFFEYMLETAKPLSPKPILWNKNINDARQRLAYTQMSFCRDVEKICSSTKVLGSSSGTKSKSSITSSMTQQKSALAKIGLCFSWSSTLFYPFPITIMLVLLMVMSVSISHYIFRIAFYYNINDSLDLFYLACMTFIILMIVLYPLLLVVTAVVNTIFYVYGMSYYGIRRETDSRMKNIYVAMPAFIKLAKCYTFNTRTRSLGNYSDQKLHLTTMKRSLNWCKQLILSKKTQARKYIRYNNVETLIFVFVALNMMNLKMGLLKFAFFQTAYLARSLDVYTASNQQDRVFTLDGVWDHIFEMFSTIETWRSNTSLIYMEASSAVRVRQIRVQPYHGNCSADFPDLLHPRCAFSVEESRIETRDFGDSWDSPLNLRSRKAGPYTYNGMMSCDNIVTANYRYPRGGYNILISGSKKNLEKLSYLRNHSWVDEYTKAVVVSINLMDIDSGLLTVIENVYEFTPAGIFMYTGDLHTFKINRAPIYDFLIAASIVIFFVLTVYFIVCEIKSCFELGPVVYFTSYHSWYLLIERAVSVAVIEVYLVLDEEEDKKRLEVFKASIHETGNTDFIDFHSLARSISSFVLFNSLLTICCYIKVLLRFRENRLLGIFVSMIPAVSRLILIPLICMIAFAMMGCLLFHSLLRPYNRIGTSMGTVTVLMLETSTILPTIEASAIVGRVYIIILYSVMFYLIMNFFIVMLNESYSELKRNERLHSRGTRKSIA